MAASKRNYATTIQEGNAQPTQTFWYCLAWAIPADTPNNKCDESISYHDTAYCGVECNSTQLACW